MSKRTILITGCSSGIGRMTTKYFQEKGWNVVATVRRNPEAEIELNALDNVLVITSDVTKEDTIRGADAEQVIAARKQMEDDEYMAMMRSQMGLPDRSVVEMPVGMLRVKPLEYIVII